MSYFSFSLSPPSFNLSLSLTHTHTLALQHKHTSSNRCIIRTLTFSLSLSISISRSHEHTSKHTHTCAHTHTHSLSLSSLLQESLLLLISPSFLFQRSWTGPILLLTCKNGNLFKLRVAWSVAQKPTLQNCGYEEPSVLGGSTGPR